MRCIVKPYFEWTPEEKKVSQEIWERYLDVFCPPVDMWGDHKCDVNWYPCDTCRYDYDLNKEVAKTHVERGIPITPTTYSQFKEDLMLVAE